MSNDNKELNMNDLENISGGIIVNCGPLRNYRIVDDVTGEIIDTDWITTDYAKRVAEYNGVSTEIITMEEYKKRFGKDIDLSVRVEAPAPKGLGTH